MHYRKHIFCCVNDRPVDHPRCCCNRRGATKLRTYMKKRAKKLGLTDMRVNNAGCLERCELGPAMVVYPEGVWYHYESFEDVDEILSKHIQGDEYVERLMLDDGQLLPPPVKFPRLRLKVSSLSQISEKYLKVELVSCDGSELSSFKAGAHIDLLIKELGIRRSYSLINAPSERHRYLICISCSKDSRGGSQWLHNNLKIRAEIEAGPPQSNFQVNESAPFHVLAASGSGVTPIMSLSHRFNEIGADYRVHYFASSKADLGDELKELCGDRANIYLQRDQKIDQKLRYRILNYSEGSQLYVSGSNTFVEQMLSAAQAWPRSHIHTEWFSKRKLNQKQNQEFDVVLARRKTAIKVKKEQSILEALIAAKIVDDFPCEGGLCGACRTQVIHGKVEHRDVVLSDREKSAARLMMICESRAAVGEEQLILDI